MSELFEPAPELADPELAAANVVYFTEKPVALSNSSDLNITIIELSFDMIGGGIELPQSFLSSVMLSPSKTATLSQ